MALFFLIQNTLRKNFLINYMTRIILYVQTRLKSFKYAFKGLILIFREEPNARIHLLAAICAVIAGLCLNINSMEWIAITFAIGLVITLEIVNSAIEKIADFISPEKNEIIKNIKDLSAAAVLVVSITALIVGLIIFLPKLYELLLAD